MNNDCDWDNWFETQHPKLDGSASGLVLMYDHLLPPNIPMHVSPSEFIQVTFWEANACIRLASRGGERNIDPVERTESNDWINNTQKEVAHREQESQMALRETGGRRNVRKLPFSEHSFAKIAKKFYIHDSIVRVISRADVSDFSAVKLDMEKQDDHDLSAYGILPSNHCIRTFFSHSVVYNVRTSNAWDGDHAISATYFPHCNLTFAVIFGCTLSVEAEILRRLETTTYEVLHPLLVPSMLVELERKRHFRVVEDTLDEVEARILELSETPGDLESVPGTEKVRRKEAKRSAWLDMLYLRNQLVSWITCLEALNEHVKRLNRTIFRDTYVCCQNRYNLNKKLSDIEGSSTDSDADWDDSFNESSLANSTDDERIRKPYGNKIDSMELQSSDCPKVSSPRFYKDYMRRTGSKMRGRLREVMKDYNEKIRECTTGVEGMVMATQWAQGETNVEIALATNQDSRHMRSIALVTMIFLPGTFFASVFSMGFFEWDADSGTVSVSKSFWIYAVLALVCTALTVAAWWYLGVYRHKRRKNVSSLLETGRISNLKRLELLLSQTGR
ncbi:hypothetical protein FLONG3_125 [Fusarium longipes]|uniref:Uncharacterized protein n=1 Tax=Fusarium longipes TaxID=694270 RepID=A0A395TAI1_9HYPO|nr:hypothetical protein FLONG3_125 [Fusarium longipes]